MKTLPVLLFLIGGGVSAAIPDTRVVQSCLAAKSLSTSITLSELDTKTYYSDSAYAEGVDGTFLIERGHEVFGAGARRGDPSLIYSNKAFPLKHAVPVAYAKSPVEFEPQLAFWGILQRQRSDYLCVSFEFPGVGHSGNFQHARGAYLLEISGPEPHRLYYAEGRAR